MAKLQLYITKSTNGFRPLYNINPSEDIRNQIVDLREAVKQIDYDAAEKNIFYMLQSTNEGTFVTVLRTIPSRPGDHLAAWIYIPNEMVVDADDLERIVKLTTKKVSGSGVSSEDIAALREAFSAEFATDRSRPAMTGGNRSGAYAWRLYGGDEAPAFHEFMGRGLWQQSYLPYRGVLLIDEELHINASGDDLTDLPLQPRATILPPEATDDGFKPYVFGRLLDTPMLASLGAETTIFWKRPGFQDVSRVVTIDSTEFTPDNVATGESRKLITPHSFSITSHYTREPVADARIMVNGHDITQEGRSFTRAELTSASVVVHAEGFFPYNAHHDLASSTRVLIQMQERRKVYIFELPVKSSDLGAPIKFEIQSKREITESPLEGYKLLDDIQEGATRCNHLGYAGGSLLDDKSKIVYTVIGFIAGLIIAFLLGKCGGGSETVEVVDQTTVATETPDTTATTGQAAKSSLLPMSIVPDTKNLSLQNEGAESNKQPATPTPEPAKADPSKPVSTQAISYLDGDRQWSRADLEKFPELVGLYDDMNNFRLQRLVEYWGPRLEASKNFADVIKFSNNSLKTKKSERLSGTFNTDDKNTIKLQNYFYRIDP